MASANCLYRLCYLQTARKATPVLSSSTQGAYGARLRELKSGLLVRRLEREGAGLRALEVGTALLWGYGLS